jgi:hypothetical protein
MHALPRRGTAQDAPRCRQNFHFTVVPVPGLDPGIVAGTFVSLAVLLGEDVDGRDKQAMTPNKSFKMTGTRYRRPCRRAS